MRTFIFVLVSTVCAWNILAQETDKDGKIIVIGETPGKIVTGAPKVFVESGTENLTGSPEAHIKAAYRTWQSACSEWKKELKRLNGSNLMVSSCGTPSRAQETIQSEKYYTYTSKAHYKIRVIGK